LLSKISELAKALSKSSLEMHKKSCLSFISSGFQSTLAFDVVFLFGGFHLPISLEKNLEGQPSRNIVV
jgi:hypothetical protein